MSKTKCPGCGESSNHFRAAPNGGIWACDCGSVWSNIGGLDFEVLMDENDGKRDVRLTIRRNGFMAEMAVEDPHGKPNVKLYVGNPMPEENCPPDVVYRADLLTVRIVNDYEDGHHSERDVWVVAPDLGEYELLDDDHPWWEDVVWPLTGDGHGEGGGGYCYTATIIGGEGGWVGLKTEWVG